MIKCSQGERTEQQVKIGFTQSGSQRYWCKVCRRKYTPEPKVHGYSAEFRRAAVQQAVDGGNYRRIGRTLGVDHQTIANWVKRRSDELADAPPVPYGELTVNELDELFTFIGAKKTKSTA